MSANPASLHPDLRPGISIVVPVFNSQDTLEELVGRLEAALTGRGEDFEVILVNDGSRDESWSAIQALAGKYPWLRGINMMRNYGQHNAVLCGIRSARYDFTVTLDDDLQHPPEEIAKLLGKLEEGYDVVYGPAVKMQHGLWRNAASKLARFAMQSSMGPETAENISAFRAFRTHLREAFANYRGPYVSIDVLLTWGSDRFTAVPVNHEPRASGKSSYNLRLLIRHGFDVLTAFSTLPLKITSLVGFGFTLFGFGVLVYVIGRFFYEGGSVPGFPFLASTIAIFSGAQLFALGVIGEYLARVHFRTMNRPAYLVRERLEPPETQDPASPDEPEND